MTKEEYRELSDLAIKRVKFSSDCFNIEQRHAIVVRLLILIIDKREIVVN